ncbi:MULTISPECIES: hypothetical protein [unclassified Pseudomonas]|uniref:hypothetical protein n=1 Tax=unclassified Pseudomonas TaxID=196821 RepID=UPI0025F1E785|nr:MULTISPECIES: hypothetical protein [unclassified Pseudomonas]
MENYKFLYELSRKALDEELDRYKKLDEKASRFVSILSVSIVGFTALINAAAPKILPISSAGLAAWTFIVLAVLTLLTFFSAWLRIFSSIKLADSPRVHIDEETIHLAATEDLITMYDSLAGSCQAATLAARGELKKKTACLTGAYKEIRFSTYLLCASIGVYFWIAAMPIGVVK